MPLSKKQKIEGEDEEHEDESSYDEEDSISGSEVDEDFDPNEEIMIDFEARSILESDREAIKVLLQQKLGPFQQINLYELATIISQQENLGNVINQADEEEGEKPDGEEVEPDDTIFGVLSMIDLNFPQSKSFSAEFVKFLKANIDSDKGEKLDTYLKSASYIVNERFLNIPTGISIPMFESLLEDVKNLSEGSANKNCDYWIFLSRFFSHDSKSKVSSKMNAPDLEYSNPEEEIFEEFSEFKCDISYGQKGSKATGGKWSLDDPTLTPCLRLFVLDKNKVKDALEKVKQLIK